MKLVYLLGAGASCEAIPIVSDFNKALKEMSKELPNVLAPSMNFYSRGTSGKTQHDVRVEIQNLLSALYEDSERHASIDTLAKKYWLQNNFESYSQLKRGISTFFLLRHIMFGLDKRYDLFFASILNKQKYELIIPNNIDIISWNYDFQVEASFLNFINANDLNSLEQVINVFPSINDTLGDLKKINLIKLNGSAGGIYNKDNKSYSRHFAFPSYNYQTISQEAKGSVIYNALDHFVAIDEKNEASLSFSWEESETNDRIRASAKKIISSADAVVIIGYSFPTFNRLIDKEIFSNISPLCKIYLQVPAGYIMDIKQKISALLVNRSIDIVPVTGVNEFYIPNEYN